MGLDTYFDVTVSYKDARAEIPVIYLRKCYSLSRKMICALKPTAEYDETIEYNVCESELRNYLNLLKETIQNELTIIFNADFDKEEFARDSYDAVWLLTDYVSILSRNLANINIFLLFLNRQVELYDLLEYFDRAERIEYFEPYEDELLVDNFDFSIYFSNSL